METTQFIEVTHLCKQYNVTETLFEHFQDTGLLQITVVETRPCIHIDTINRVDKMLRMHQELGVNPEGIDVIMNLLEKIDDLNNKVNYLKQELTLHRPE